ncbi:primosomal protein N' [Xanthomonas campestris pv. campestris]|uniref:primosomal protein N' n=1 Tax=Xanthomonas campestris TaxID=339 RepID=UPI000C2909BB|nr:primosomal protein N' [Xanthomonas campestris]MCD0249673.1 primosomal protein N' [Xanthomonas campestris pv. campestris]MCD0262454.1 primosomal protein N' [Xanthomonas campestris pv. campestris]MCD0271200.1 primosomal protein N' [Xanthomonas campestris pv. campestris]MDO0828326.1 primosomal protein N' [Xanthomonas campestris pv. campestris]MEB1076725.1 primosomal protein N' [Xanthomonas campestris pv. campestris]
MSAPVTTLRVALPVPLPQLFDYLPPQDTAVDGSDRVGCRVRVPFGPRELIGVVVERGQQPSAEGLRAALDWCDDTPLLIDELARSLQWLARYTHAPLGEAQASALPGPLRRGEPLADTHAWAWQLTEAGHTGAGSLRAGSRPALLAALLLAGPLAEEPLEQQLPQWREAARNLAKRGYAERVAVAADTLPARPGTGPQLNDEQQAATDAIRAGSGFATYLLDGVTGSGKTEVYLQAIADCLAAGKQALVLVPEIGLTPQTLGRFRERLGVPVHALHSGLSDGERARVWAAAWRGEAKLIVGTRSAVFTPLPNAGLIVIDEEHDGSYKQQDGIRYHARDFALVRGKALDVPVILGSATPSLESLHNAYSGRYRHLRLSRRAGDARPPRVRVLDVRKRPLKDGLSPEVLAGIGATLARGEQVLVFKNRRGYAPVLLCHDCGWTAACQRCSTPLHQTPMTVHAGGRRLQCHHCGARQPAPLACPACASLALQPQGIGTERLEERLVEAFPEAPVVRIDRSTTQRRDALETQLARLGTDAGILVGTQILAKGHDLPRLTMVVVVGIDEGLFSADFRAAEKLAQQLIQVAGRAGRADRPGEVWLQTHHPEHPLLQTLVNGGYHAFADAELQQREAAGFPPFAHLALFRAEAKDVAAANQFLIAVRALVGAQTPAPSPAITPVECYGPMPAPMPRRAGFQRTQLLLSAAQRSALHRVLDAQMPAIHTLPQARRVRWSLDVDPIDLY